MTYEKSFKEEAVRLSDEIGVKKAAEQLGVPYYTLADWRQQRKQFSAQWKCQEMCSRETPKI